MKQNSIPQLSTLIQSNELLAVFNEAKNIFLQNYDEKYFVKIEECFFKAKALFNGGFPGFRACNTGYHNIYHTSDAFLAAVRLIDGHNLSCKTAISGKTASSLLIAALMHDTGYIQEETDENGTGAKYTVHHVERSIDFINRYHSDFGIMPDQIEEVNRYVSATDFGVDFKTLNFETDEQHEAACILATADLIGQMADRAYLEKLLFLYYEFREANIPGYDTEFDILRKTSGFYEIAKKRITEALDSVYLFARDHFRARFNIDCNLYINEMDKNIAYIHKILEDDTVNFRHKLKRWDLNVSGKNNLAVTN